MCHGVVKNDNIKFYFENKEAHTKCKSKFKKNTDAHKKRLRN